MSKKNNLKSVRISDEVMQYILNFAGEGFNQKFENLVLFCMKEEDEKRALIRSLDDQIEDRKRILDKFSRLEREADSALRLLRGASDNIFEFAKYIKGMGMNLR